MEEDNGSQTEYALVARHGRRNLQAALAADEVGLEVRTERISAPGNPGGMQTGAAQEGIVDHGAEGFSGWQ